MGREIKRVPLDFNWPLNKIWPGFCYTTPDCDHNDCPESDSAVLPWSKDALCVFHRMLWDDYSLSPDIEPPTGDGWQVWETVSQGSPISPVFADRERLIDWLCSPAYSWGISTPLTREQAERFVDSAWAPTMVFTPSTGLIPGEKWDGGDES